MSLLKIYHSQALQATLDEITAPVEVIYQAIDAPVPDTLAALDELMKLSPYLSVVTQSAQSDDADRVIVRNEQGREMLFAGAPIGTELAALVSAIVVAGRGDSGLSPSTRQTLAALRAPVHLEVFSTPT